MGKIVKYGIIPITLIALGLFFIYKITAKTWVYDLPNNYKIRKTNTNVVLGVEIEKDFYTTKDGKKVGIKDYIAEFQYNEEFVGVKALTIKNDETSLLFYFVDTKEQELHGPYQDEENYLAAIGVWSKEPLGEWITTTEVPEGAYFK